MTRKLNIRNLLALLILLLAGTLVVTVVHNFRGGSPEKAVDALPRNVDFSLKELTYHETRDGVRRWSLVATRASHSLGEGLAKIENVRMTFYDGRGAEDVTLAARSGTFRVEAREVEAEGDVVVKSPRGYILYTDRLAYRDADRIIRTEAPVRLVSERGELSGRGLRLDLQARTVELLADVRARLEAVPGPGGRKG
jgi:LPS export ABC transporter protein LptC